MHFVTIYGERRISGQNEKNKLVKGGRGGIPATNSMSSSLPWVLIDIPVSLNPLQNMFFNFMRKIEQQSRVAAPPAGNLFLEYC